ncbi:MAG: hypothetical protein Q9184_003028 [Pyrenodesmia sp. 2 TL-2023]
MSARDGALPEDQESPHSSQRAPDSAFCHNSFHACSRHSRDQKSPETPNIFQTTRGFVFTAKYRQLDGHSAHQKPAAPTVEISKLSRSRDADPNNAQASTSVAATKTDNPLPKDAITAISALNNEIS